MAAHAAQTAVLQWGCRALLNICHGSDAAAAGRRRAAADLGCVRCVAQAMAAHPEARGLQLWASRALLAIAIGPLPRVAATKSAGGAEEAAAAGAALQLA